MLQFAFYLTCCCFFCFVSLFGSNVLSHLTIHCIPQSSITCSSHPAVLLSSHHFFHTTSFCYFFTLPSSSFIRVRSCQHHCFLCSAIRVDFIVTNLFLKNYNKISHIQHYLELILVSTLFDIGRSNIDHVESISYTNLWNSRLVTMRSILIARTQHTINLFFRFILFCCIQVECF